MRKIDYISIPVESARTTYYEEFHSKIEVISQGFNIKPLNLTQKLHGEIQSFAYAGGFIIELRDLKAFPEYSSNRKKLYLYPVHLMFNRIFSSKSYIIP